MDSPKKRKKQILALLLMLIMCINIMQIPVFAANVDPGHTIEIKVAKVYLNEYGNKETITNIVTCVNDRSHPLNAGACQTRLDEFYPTNFGWRDDNTWLGWTKNQMSVWSPQQTYNDRFYPGGSKSIPIIVNTKSKAEETIYLIYSEPPYITVNHYYYANGNLEEKYTENINVDTTKYYAYASDYYKTTCKENEYEVRSSDPVLIDLKKNNSAHKGTFNIYYDRTIPRYGYQLTWDYNNGKVGNDGKRTMTVTDQSADSYVFWADTQDFGNPLPTREGYEFANWEYTGNGTYTTSSGQIEMVGVKDQTVSGNLTAVWNKNPVIKDIKLTYDPNKPSDVADTVENMPQDNPQTQTVTDDEKAVFSIEKGPTLNDYDFIGWSTNKDDNDIEYGPGDTVAINTDTTLYAIWQPKPKVTLSYNANGGQNAPGSETKIKGSTFTVKDKESMAYDDKIFTKWNTKADNTGSDYTPGTDLTLSENATLYAQWEDKDNEYQLIYHENADSDIVTNMPDPKTVSSNSTTDTSYTFTVTDNIPSRDHYDFKEWNTEPDGTGTKYQNKDHITADTVTPDLHLYAIWEEVVPEHRYSLTYHENADNVSHMPDPKTVTEITKNKSHNFTISNTIPTREDNYIFTYWNTKENNTGTAYSPNDTITVTKDNPTCHLYAQYEKLYTVTYKWDSLPDGLTDNDLVDLLPDSKNYRNGTIVKINDLSKDHEIKIDNKTYTFNGWNVPVDNKDDQFTMPEHDVVITGTWKPVIPEDSNTSYTVIHEYYTNGIKDGEFKTGKIRDKIGNTITNIDPIDKYNENDYVYKSTDPELPFILQKDPDENMIILRYERVIENKPEYKVIYTWKNLPPEATETLPTEPDHEAGDTIEIDTKYKNNTQITINNKTYIFSGWSTEDITIKNNAFIMPDKDVTITGIWIEKPTTSTDTDNSEDNITYTVIHEYYTNGIKDKGGIKETVNAKTGDEIKADDITKQPKYNGKAYVYTSASPKTILLKKDSKNTIVLRYDRKTNLNYKVKWYQVTFDSKKDKITKLKNTETRTATKAGNIVSVTKSDENIKGYTYINYANSSNKHKTLEREILKDDGSTVLRLYFKKNSTSTPSDNNDDTSPTPKPSIPNNNTPTKHDPTSSPTTNTPGKNTTLKKAPNESVPLANNPQTGDNDTTVLWTILLLSSLLMITVTTSMLAIKKHKN